MFAQQNFEETAADVQKNLGRRYVPPADRGNWSSEQTLNDRFAGGLPSVVVGTKSTSSVHGSLPSATPSSDLCSRQVEMQIKSSKELVLIREMV